MDSRGAGPIVNGDDCSVALRPGDRHYRAYVGPPGDYDLIGALQFTLLFQAGLRDTHRLLDLGCGSLRGGRLFIPYLRPDRYYGVEPNRWLVDEGIERELGADVLRVKRPSFSTTADFSLASLDESFDFVLAHSVLSHTFPDLAARALRGVADCLAPGGVVVATFMETGAPPSGSGWLYPGCVAYPWSDLRALAESVGLVVRRLTYPHPRQAWFAGALGDEQLDDVIGRLRTWGVETAP